MRGTDSEKESHPTVKPPPGRDALEDGPTALSSPWDKALKPVGFLREKIRVFQHGQEPP